MSDMTEVAPNVFVGGWSAARDHGNEFDVIINCAVDAPNYGEFQFSIVDGPGNKREEVQAAIACVEEAVRSGKRVLVHCMAGFSRSVTVTAAALSRVTGRPFHEVLTMIAEARKCEPVRPYCPHAAMVEIVQ